MPTLLIVYHSMTGGTAQMVRAAAEGARTHDVLIDVRLASDTRADHVLGASSYLFAAPENLATMSGIMKDFFDRTYYDVLERVNGRAYGLMVCAGSDGSGAAQQLARIAAGWRLKAVAPPVIVCTHAQSPEAIGAFKHVDVEDLERCRELGATLAAGTALGVF